MKHFYILMDKKTACVTRISCIYRMNASSFEGDKSMHSLLSEPYAERQIIVIGPKNEKEASSSVIDWKEFANSLGVDWTKLSKKLSADWKVAGIDLKKLAGGSAKFYIKSHPLYLSIQGSKKVYNKLSKKDSTIDFNRILILTHEQAASELSFPPGHPLIDFCYVGHPIQSTHYFPIASFHNILFEQKVNELVTLIASLGAQRLRVRCTQGYKSSAGFSFGVSEPQSSAEAGVGGGYNSELTREGILEETYSPTGSPKIPEGLVWFDSEQSWQALAKRRLDFNTKTFQTQLIYTEDYGINTNLTLGLQNCGVKLGTNFKKFESTIWEFEGEFE